ncbi:MAG TPA: hypothetical protein VKN36_07730, partial [Eudoraea sp.]|nr:hypothetical protein [Eudoraea sp.]
RGCSPPEVNGMYRLSFALMASHHQLLFDGPYHRFLFFQVRGKMKVTIVAGLLAERDMDVNTAHRVRREQ